MENFKYNVTNGCGGGTSNSCGANSCGSNGEKDIAVPLELHTCMGLNACKGHDRYGTNNCVGSGQCATVQHVCHTLNKCKGQGGCGLYGDSEEQCKPGANDCSWQGSCGSPITAERFITQGKNQGRSVWQLARVLFEERMDKAKRTVKPAPFKYGPPVKWLDANGRGSSCGHSGNKYCSFGQNNAAADAQEFCVESAAEMENTRENCGCHEMEIEKVVPEKAVIAVKKAALKRAVSKTPVKAKKKTVHSTKRKS
jgi:hypothetical protein